ncbi:Non-hem dioxygenase N-terminal domain [Dillenia turbinata]|uniref:Non-hem dioxygenase N-terminal domain n=1 Tax=Dillenia turbinata TaxID=194707 RepID=A0AAN8VDT8_9MAGN
MEFYSRVFKKLNFILDAKTSHTWPQFDDLSTLDLESNNESTTSIIPILDFSDPNVSKLNGHACATSGTFLLINHNGPLNLIESAESEVRKLLSQPTSQKRTLCSLSELIGYGNKVSTSWVHRLILLRNYGRMIRKDFGGLFFHAFPMHKRYEIAARKAFSHELLLNTVAIFCSIKELKEFLGRRRRGHLNKSEEALLALCGIEFIPFNGHHKPSAPLEDRVGPCLISTKCVEQNLLSIKTTCYNPPPPPEKKKRKINRKKKAKIQNKVQYQSTQILHPSY